MTLQGLYERLNRLLCEENMLQQQEDASLPEGKIGYKHTKRSYKKADGTVHNYYYRRTYYLSKGRQSYLNRKESIRVSQILAAREMLRQVKSELVILIEEINTRQAEPITLKEMQRLFAQNKAVLAEVREQSQKNKRDIEYPCIAADGTVTRSRSEVVVANLISLIGMLYVYEPLVRTPGGHCPYRRPDFCVLTPLGIVYIEIMGMCNDKNYLQEQKEKLKEYQDAGLELGKNLMVIEVRDERRINSQIIFEQLQNLLIGNVPKESVIA